MDVRADMQGNDLSLLRVRGIDWKGLGYLVSIISVFLLGAIAWPKPDDPRWHVWALVAGMATSVIGMGLRYYSHRQQQRELRRAEAEAAKANAKAGKPGSRQIQPRGGPGRPEAIAAVPSSSGAGSSAGTPFLSSSSQSRNGR